MHNCCIIKVKIELGQGISWRYKIRARGKDRVICKPRADRDRDQQIEIQELELGRTKDKIRS